MMDQRNEENVKIDSEVGKLKLEGENIGSVNVQDIGIEGDKMVDEQYQVQMNQSVAVNSLQSKKSTKKRQCRKKIAFTPRNLLAPYQHIIPQLIQKPQKSKRKATNIPKFIIKIFYKTLAVFPSAEHNERLREFSKQLQSSITRFHLVQLFGLKPQSQIRDQQNKINRQVLRRLLVRNYDNILSNSHIQHKRIYLLFSKKMQLRLNEPRLVGNIEI